VPSKYTRKNYSNYVHYFRQKFQSFGWMAKPKKKNGVSNVGVIIKHPIVVVVVVV
jgi:hypothetical protein